MQSCTVSNLGRKNGAMHNFHKDAMNRSKSNYLRSEISQGDCCSEFDKIVMFSGFFKRAKKIVTLVLIKRDPCIFFQKDQRIFFLFIGCQQNAR